MSPKSFRRERNIRTWPERARIFGPAILLSVLALIVTYHFVQPAPRAGLDRKSTRLNSSHGSISYAVFCLKKKIGSVQSGHIGALKEFADRDLFTPEQGFFHGGDNVRVIVSRIVLELSHESTDPLVVIVVV